MVRIDINTIENLEKAETLCIIKYMLLTHLLK